MKKVTQLFTLRGRRRRRNVLHKVFCLLVVVQLVVSILPLNALAAEETESPSWWEYLLSESLKEQGGSVRRFYDATVGAWLEGFTGDASGVKAAYDDNYLPSVQSVLGTTLLGKTSYFIPLTPNDVVWRADKVAEHANLTYPAYSYFVTNHNSGGTTNYSLCSNLYASAENPVTFTIPNSSTVRLVFDTYKVNGPNLYYLSFPSNVLTWNSILGGNSVSVPTNGFSVSGNVPSDSFTTVYYRAAYEIQPYNYLPNTFTSFVGGSDSRVGNIPIEYNYGRVGEGGGLTRGGGAGRIMKETELNYYNPVTDIATPITNWQYDYTTRSYIVTTNTNETVTITYGDEYITINEGDTVTNVYYGSVNDSGGGSGGDTDSEGGFLGWLAEQFGNIFGTLGAGVVNLLKSALEPVFNAITGLLQMVMDKLGGIVQSVLGIFNVLPGLFNGFSSFLSAFFSFLPENGLVIVDIIVVGLAMMIVVVVFKAIRG